MFKVCDYRGGVHIEIEKKSSLIGAGLEVEAGNAATALDALNQLLKDEFFFYCCAAYQSLVLDFL